MKYHGERARAHHLGTLLTSSLNELLAAEPLAIVIPVPLHPGRERERGFNQSSLFARAALTTVGRTSALQPSGLSRIRVTRQQVGLDPAERAHNVAGAFVADVDLVAARPIILVDDVFTTGSTLASCSLALREAGAAEVAAVTVSRASWSVDHWA